MKHFALAALLASSFTAFANPAPGMGNWTITGDVQGVPVTEDCSFTIDADNKITGKCTLSKITYDTTGKVDGKSITFSHGGEYEGQQLVLTYSGSLSDDGASFGGSIDVAPMQVSGVFSAKKAEEKKAEEKKSDEK